MNFPFSSAQRSLEAQQRLRIQELNQLVARQERIINEKDVQIATLRKKFSVERNSEPHAAGGMVD